MINKSRLCIVGLGYVGLPLAIEFSKHYLTFGYDTNKLRIENLKKNKDINNEMSSVILKKSKIKFTSKEKDLKNCNTYIVTVPTPIKKNNLPDLRILKKATRLISKYLKPKDLVIYESTVYPGVTEDVCIPILEEFSGLKLKNKKNYPNGSNYFYCGYSPERMNPGDKIRTLSKIPKLVSSNDNFSLNLIFNLYKKIINEKVIKIDQIRIAEAAKIIENIQRDVNVALVNELSIIFDKLNIPTSKVLYAASTKWNFNKYEPGLVGGHCIGVDPYYLAYIAKAKKIFPKMILSGRQINNNMPKFISSKLKNLMKEKLIQTQSSKILILGFTFKENCSDFRNTLVFDMYNLINKFTKKVDIYDPNVNTIDVKKVYNIQIKTNLINQRYDCIILAVKHNIFKKLDNYKNISKIIKQKNIVIDLKDFFKNIKVDYKL